MDGGTPPISEREQQGRGGGDFHLLVVARCFQGSSARQELIVEFRAPLKSGTIEGRDNCLQFLIRRVDQNYSPVGKQRSEQAGKGRPERFAGAVGIAECCR